MATLSNKADYGDGIRQKNRFLALETCGYLTDTTGDVEAEVLVAVYVYMYICIYVYIYIYREREREIDILKRYNIITYHPTVFLCTFIKF